jgi:hypothetical protein
MAMCVPVEIHLERRPLPPQPRRATTALDQDFTCPAPRRRNFRLTMPCPKPRLETLPTAPSPNPSPSATHQIAAPVDTWGDMPAYGHLINTGG